MRESKTVAMKFVVDSITERPPKARGQVCKEIVLSPLFVDDDVEDGKPRRNACEENHVLGTGVPRGGISLTVQDPAAARQFRAGQIVEVALTPAAKK